MKAKCLFVFILLIIFVSSIWCNPEFKFYKRIRMVSPASEPANYPAGIAFRDDKAIFFSEWKNGRIFRFSPEGKFVGYFAEKLPGPIGIAFDSKGQLFIVCSNSNQVLIYDRSANPVHTLSGTDNPQKPFSSPRGIAIGEKDQVYVCDSDNARIVCYSSSLDFVREIIFQYGKYNEPQKPRGICVLPGGNLAVTYSEMNRIAIFSEKGELLEVFGSGGEGKEQFSSARYITSDQDGVLYITDYNNDRIQMFDQKGNHLGVVTAPVYRKSSGIGRPEGIACDSSGLIYACNTSDGSVMIFNPPEFNVQYNLARNYYYQGNTELALKHFEKAFLMDRNHSHCSLMVKKIYLEKAKEEMEKKNFEETVVIYDKLKDYFPSMKQEIDFHLKKLEIHQFRFVYYCFALGMMLFIFMMMFRSAYVSVKD